MFKNISFLEGAILLIVLYLILTHWQGFAGSVTAGTQGAIGLVKAFQGRS